jgi:hypothetical protein
VADLDFPVHVFLDTQVYIRFNFQYESTTFKALKDLIAKDLVKLVITNIVVREVEANIDRSVRHAFNSQKKFIKEARSLAGSGIAGVAQKIQAFDRDEVIKDLVKQFNDFLAEVDADIVETDDVSIDELMDDYFAGAPPFGGGQPKAEFPDAINVIALDEWAETEGVDIIAVSGDQAMRDACAGTDHVEALSEMKELLDKLATANEVLSEFIKDQVKAHEANIRKLVISAFEDKYFYLTDENGDAEVTVQTAEPDDEVDILELEEEEAVVEMTYTLAYQADATYDDPDSQSYDSETGNVYSWGSRETTVNRDAWARAEVRVRFKGIDPDEFGIDSVEVPEPGDSIGIQLEEDPRYYK